MLTIFDHLSGHLQKTKESQNHHNWFLVNCRRLVRFSTSSSKNMENFSWKSCPWLYLLVAQVSWSPDLRFTIYSKI